MSLVQIKSVGGYLTLAQKQEMIRKVTDAVLSVEGEGLRHVTWVTIEDVQAWADVGLRQSTSDQGNGVIHAAKPVPGLGRLAAHRVGRGRVQ